MINFDIYAMAFTRSVMNIDSIAIIRHSWNFRATNLLPLDNYGVEHWRWGHIDWERV